LKGIRWLVAMAQFYGTIEAVRQSPEESAVVAKSSSIMDSAKPADIRDRFQKLAAEWKLRSRFLSNTAQMAMLPSYQRIIGMGLPEVPLILEELQRDPDQWFWALEAITEANPVAAEAAGNVQKMKEAWVEWGRNKGLLTNDLAPRISAPDSR
jgi:hypothetical protein